MWVEMMVYISGGRGDGTDWPQPGQGEHSKLNTGEVEAADLVKGKLARYTDPPPWAYAKEEPAPPPPPPAPPAPPAPPQIIDEVAPGRDRVEATNTSGPGTETSGAATETKTPATKTSSGSRTSSTRKTAATK